METVDFSNDETKAPSSQGHPYWLNGQVYFLDGKAYGLDEELETVCLGKEAEILPVLKGDKPIPKDIQGSRRAVLESILEEKEDATATATRGRRPVRSRPIGVIRHREKNPR